MFNGLAAEKLDKSIQNKRKFIFQVKRDAFLNARLGNDLFDVARNIDVPVERGVVSQLADQILNINFFKRHFVPTTSMRDKCDWTVSSKLTMNMDQWKRRHFWQGSAN